MANNTLSIKGKPIQLPKTELIDIAHFAEGLFSKGLLTYEDVTPLAKTLNKIMRNKIFEHGGVSYRVMKVQAIGKDIKMRITRMEG